MKDLNINMKPIDMLRGDTGKCISRLKVGNVFQNKAKSRNNERVMGLDYFESTNNSQKLRVNYFIEKGGVGLLVGNLRNAPGYFDAFWGLRAAGIEGIDRQWSRKRRTFNFNFTLHCVWFFSPIVFVILYIYIYIFFFFLRETVFVIKTW